MVGFKLKFSLFLLFFSQLVFSQLSNFTLTVSHTNETCPNNGSLTFSVSNTVPGSTVVYAIYLLPNTTTPISLQSTNTLSGLNSGTYRIVATQSLNGNTGTQQQDVIIEDDVDTLTYQMTSANEICGFDGTITVNTITGTAVSYEIFSGPVIKPSQPSNVFTSLTTGTYQIRVYDNCGEGVVQTFTVQYTNPAIVFDVDEPALSGCNSVRVGADFTSLLAYPQGIVKFPLQITTTVFPPSGPPVTFNQTVNSGIGFTQIIPLYNPQPYNYTFTITDGCGVVYTLNGVVDNLSVEAGYLILPDGCLHKRAVFFNVSAVTLVSAPAGFSTSLPISYTSQIINNMVSAGGLIGGTYVFETIDICGIPQVFTIEIIITPPPPPSHIEFNINCITGSLIIYDIQQVIMVSGPANYPIPLPHDYTGSINSSNYIGFNAIPVGMYTFNVIDLCGESHVLVIALLPPPQPVTIDVLEGCQEGLGTVRINWQFVTANMISAPPTYGFPLPHDLASFIMINGVLILNSLPAGDYVIQATNSCNTIENIAFTILGYQDDTAVDIIPNCGSFDLNLMHSSTNIIGTTFWLQKLNPATGIWGHPFTGNAYTDGTMPTTQNSVLLTNNTTNYNLAYQGHFRILKVFTSYASNSEGSQMCYKVIHEFDYNGLPMITDVYSISCGATFEVVVMAVGFDPLQYRITTRNGQPFLVQNGNSNVFTGLIPATYNFQVEDACGNILNSLFEISNPNPMVITANPISCNGETLTLSVPDFSFFQYQWWKDNDATVIVGNSSSLVIPSFNAAQHNGTYHVSISYGNNPASCLNQVLDYTINVSVTQPNAGLDGIYTYCGSQGTIDLFSLLQGSFDAGGVWQEITNSGTVNGNFWNSASVAFGTYQFQYAVSGSCNQTDDAFVTVTLNQIPATPTASADSIVCDTGTLHLYAVSQAGVSYQWTGPNGFLSSNQNPVIPSISSANSGVYTVSAMLQNCPSGEASVTVNVNSLPEFTVQQECLNQDYVVTVLPLANSFNPLSASFAWTGPNNFTANQNPIVITQGDTGVYQVTVTDENGCSVAQSTEIIRTICFIPNVITPNNDMLNDSFDLTGFDVDRLEIYNRWGRKVYEKDNYTNEWHGQNRQGERLPDSTYYYILNFRSGENKAGWIFLSANQ
ncbi:T9SS type B sorting domain-containing protein [Flavobacterium sedimenticola]|uniref:Gliding motility-associated C-terminal domain-containing protein n=1 Tax=Flavobacterium sedimenticola TaxID=3043286 RepID=A0ABT6XSG4_9FLAO|nr:gliding motility-associated C-terminal domain-containing protein [Flavobacterium sedimenticola]MDI9258020.1 gliding motility-associated C-terminal domain-containing protein [Flavobacterium sedimenticola]